MWFGLNWFTAGSSVRRLRRVRKNAKSDYYIPHVCPSAWNNSAPTKRIFMKFDDCEFFKNLSRKFKFHKNPARITGTLHEDLSRFMIISRSIPLRMRHFLGKMCRENQDPHLSTITCGGFLQVSYTRNNAVRPLSLFINPSAIIQDLERDRW